ncbi:putative inosine-uridine preferring nucleoside hydrolase [Staphylococcus saprophyticus subsp. saprophyticus KACC 16562]|nr:putative inosine-uridine preferring nucleoside hydrolase [Staphylococcus saprophyticus subsp. saprophyticus KACC 16562]
MVQQHSVNASVYTEGPSQGQTYIDDVRGRTISVVNDVEHDAFFKYITDLAKKVEQ